MNTTYKGGEKIVQNISETDYGFAIIAPHVKEYVVKGPITGSVFQKYMEGEFRVEVTTKNADGQQVGDVAVCSMTAEELDAITDL